MAIILDGKKTSKKIKESIKNEISSIVQKDYRAPSLAVVLVGDNQASEIYVNRKKKTSEYIGIDSKVLKYSSDISEEKLLNIIDSLNKDKNIDGILVQLPLPAHINNINIINSILPDKDVDGFHPFNAGSNIIGHNCFVPCTPLGIIKLLDEYNINISGMNAVILGRSNIVGKPLIPLLLRKDATVTICHSKTKNIKELCSNADLLISAIGKGHFVSQEYVKDGAVVVDVGISRDNKKVVGDVDFESVKNKASYITPVPGGVGPMTIAMLMYNTLKAFKMHNNL
ncbi:MAG: bifunctional methylenetetrahydrofolate dehydrogenase/methenyltetrahydrofolate cyclohydrolase FolD [Deferribacterota bacterium]|nr:bifunctional methylenetetrahydrofolate dehydrogenase/methenyltetrahydrofolate cyclohydrolase FolD [Deferribacterota bacterium]